MLRILLLVLICAPQFLWSQSFKNEAELIKQANENFEGGSFMQALPLFSQLVSLHPRNADYNFKFGSCVIYSGVDKETAIKHLEFSTKKSVEDVRAYYYLGLARHLNYDFREAKIAYSFFLDKADEKTRNKFNAQRQIEMCSNGENLLSSITDLVVLEKKEVSKNDFFRYYDLNEIGGKVIAKPEELITKNDKKKEFEGVVHFDRSSDYIFYSSYGNDGDQLDLFRVQTLANGKFSKPEKLKGDVNTSFDEDFAFMHSDGETLYFASKGHTSMGGFDVFRASYDINSDQYIQVKNLDFAVNTPDDDLFYLVDSTNTMAYFASGRSSKLDNLHVYKVRVDAVPVNLVIIQGDFISKIDEAQKSTKISIVENLSGRYIGEFHTNSSTGNYTIPFERAGTYKFEVEVVNSLLIHEGIVEIPSFDGPVALRQELILSNEGEIERLQINNFFDELLEEDIASLTQVILRRKAGLEVNADEMTAILEAQIQDNEEIEELLDNSRSLSEAAAVAGFSESLSIADIAADMKVKATVYKTDSENLKQRAKEAYSEAKIKQALAAEKSAEAIALIAGTDESDPDNYIQSINEGNLLLTESKRLSMESQSLLEVVKALDVYSSELDERATAIGRSAEIVETSKDFDEVANLLKVEKDRERRTNKEDRSDPEVVITQAADFTSKELENLVGRISALRDEEAFLERKLSGKNRILEASNKKAEIENIEIEITAAAKELVLVKNDLDQELSKIEMLSYSAENYALQRDFLQNIQSESYEFHGEPLAYSAAEIDEGIAASQANAQEAYSLIIEEQGNRSAFTDVLSRSIDLSSIQSKAGMLPYDLELTEVAVIQSEYKAQLADLSDLENAKAQEIREAVIKETYANELISGQKAIDKVLANSELTAEERMFLAAEKQNSADALGQIELNEIFPLSISPEEVKSIISEYAADEFEELTITEAELSSLEELGFENDFTQSAIRALENARKETNEQIAKSENADDVIGLNKKANAIKQGIKELNSRKYEAEFLNTVYEREVSSSPERAQEITEDYRNVIEQKIIQLDKKNITASSLEKANIMELKKKLTNQLILISTTISNSEAKVVKIEEGETSLSVTEINSMEHPSSEVLEIERTETVENIEREAEEKVNTLESIEAISSQLLTKEAITEQLAPEYKEKILAISESKEFSPLKMNEKIINANQEFISSLQDATIEKVTELDAAEEESQKDAIQSEISALVEVMNNLIEENEIFKTIIAELEALAVEESILAKESISDTSEVLTEVLEDLNSSQENISAESAAPDLPDGETVVNSESSNNSAEENIESAEVPENNAPNLTKQQIKAEVKTLPAAVTNSFYENLETSEEFTPDKLAYSEPYKDLIENSPELNNRRNKQTQIEELIQEIESRKAQETDTEKVKLNKRLAKLEKKRAKMEVNNLPSVLETAQSNYARELERLDAVIISKEAQISKSSPLSQQIQKMIAAAEVYNEAAEIYKRFAQESSKRNILKKEELYKEATAKQLAGSENLKKVDWLVSNSQELAELSPETLLLMMSDEGLAEEISAENEETTENTFKPEFSDKVLLLEDSIADVSDLEKSWDLSPGELNQVKRSEVYLDYEEKAEQLFFNVTKLVKIQGELQASQLRAKSIEEQVLEIENTIELAENESEKESFRTEVMKLRVSAQVEYAVAFRLEEDREELMTSSKDLRADLLALQITMNPTVLLAAAEKTTDFSGSEDAESIYSLSLDLSATVNFTVFSKIKDVYSETRPIPLEVRLPTGVVYKVQVGAFRNTISQSLYNDFAPVSGEALANGITRYTVGLFAEEILANDAKKEVRNLGFSDAFVVAYLNGERISLRESRNYIDSEALSAKNGTFTSEKIQTTEIDTANKSIEEAMNPSSEKALPNASSKSEITSNAEDAEVTFNPIESAADYYEKFPDAADANQIEVLSGLFFTVQVGVYSKPVPSEDIFNITPLNSERLSNNNIRYSTGIYDNLQEAVRRKEQVNNLGVDDAFVTAYYNGTRIRISAAKEKFLESGMEVTEVPSQLADDRLKSAQDNTSDARPLEQMEYVIYIGTFKNEVPANISKAIILLEESRGIVQEKVGDEVAFFTRSVKSEETARIIQREFEFYEVFSTEIRKVSN